MKHSLDTMGKGQGRRGQMLLDPLPLGSMLCTLLSYVHKIYLSFIVQSVNQDSSYEFLSLRSNASQNIHNTGVCWETDLEFLFGRIGGWIVEDFSSPSQCSFPLPKTRVALLHYSSLMDFGI